jgi:hypothetical protein
LYHIRKGFSTEFFFGKFLGISKGAFFKKPLLLCRFSVCRMTDYKRKSSCNQGYPERYEAHHRILSNQKDAQKPLIHKVF